MAETLDSALEMWKREANAVPGTASGLGAGSREACPVQPNPFDINFTGSRTTASPFLASNTERVPEGVAANGNGIFSEKLFLK